MCALFVITKTIILVFQNIEAQSSDASQLIPQHNYKLDVHALNSRRPGEVAFEAILKINYSMHYNYTMLMQTSY